MSNGNAPPPPLAEREPAPEYGGDAPPKRRPWIRRDELPTLALAWLFFFCVLGSYYVLRPIRDAFGVADGVQNYKWLYTGTFLTMLVASPWFSALAAKHRPRALVPRVFHFFALHLVAFFVLLHALPEAARFHVGNAFFVWTSVFNLFVVSVFWSFMADLHRPDQGKRLFGLIASGGSAGGFCGALLTERLVQPLGPEVLLLFSAAILEGAVLCALLLRRQAAAEVATHAATGEVSLPHEARKLPGFLEGAALLLRSRYLLGICAFMLLTTVCASIVYYQRGAIVAEALPDEAARAQAFATMDRWSQLAILLLQALAAGPLLRWLGAGRTLCVLPLLYAVGFLGLGAEPALAAVVAFEIARRVVGYGVAAPAREFLFTFVTREEKYGSKNFIDTAVWRGGDLLGIFVADLLLLVGGGLTAISIGALPLCALWIWCALALGRRTAQMPDAPT